MRLITMVPMLWIFVTSFKSPQDSIAYPPKILFQPSMEGYVNLFTARTRQQTSEYIASLPPAQTWYDKLGAITRMVIAGPSRFAERFEFSHHRLRIDLSLRIPGHACSLRIFAIQSPDEG